MSTELTTEPSESERLAKVLGEQARDLRQLSVLRREQYSRSARRAAHRHSIYGYAGALGALGTAFLSKLSAATVIFAGATVGDALFGMGLLTAAASVLAAQGLTAKRQVTQTEAAVLADRLSIELNRHILRIPIAPAKELLEIQKRLIAIENTMPADARLPSGVALIPTSPGRGP
jgi:hypothetical protein